MPAARPLLSGSSPCVKLVVVLGASQLKTGSSEKLGFVPKNCDELVVVIVIIYQKQEEPIFFFQLMLNYQDISLFFFSEFNGTHVRSLP